ncbi:hypothetical protein [Streptomyces griseus]|uniref:hypothetical protein n=1 Tax=Streptomyces griseus TaxID=1911 RepID=UPI00055B55B8|nr:hypothetical protein [Streptomyces griseus]
MARGLLSVLRSIFRALKQEQLIFRNPTSGIQASAGVHLPLSLSSDRPAGALDRLDGLASRLIVGLGASILCAPWRSPASAWPMPTWSGGRWQYTATSTL